ncbi:hypothetical protein BDV97DRAFT_205244 [Delphinella strobiligena]|nr:hypothetical protein BDV97DRAFT_205244 [Delphinella strobiligena]
MSLLHDSIFERADAAFSCPSGGTWYSCASSLFVGCCTSDNACSSVGCAAGDLKPASFDISLYDTIPDQSCPADSQWYTCSSTDPPFMGCCKSDPCATGCPTNDLAAGILNTANDAAYSPTGGSSTISTTASSLMVTSISSTSTSSSTSATSTIPVASATSPPANHRNTPTATIAGAAGGAAAGVLAILAIVFYCRRHARKSREAKQEDFQRRRSSPLEGAISTSEQPKYVSFHDSAQSPGAVYEPFSPYTPYTPYSPYASPTIASSPRSPPPPPEYPHFAHDHINAMRPGHLSQQHAPAVSELGGLGIQPLVPRAELGNTSPAQ